MESFYRNDLYYKEFKFRPIFQIRFSLVLSTKRMATMKIFSLIISHFKLMGIDPSKTRWGYPLNWRTLAVLIFHIHFLLSTTAFFWLEAKTIAEYADSFYAAISAVGNINVFIVNVLKMKEVFQLIACLEDTVESRKWLFTRICVDLQKCFFTKYSNNFRNE